MATSSVAILVGYNGSGFSDFERAKGVNTVEAVLLSTLKNVSVTHVSRALLTGQDHAARQVISLRVTGAMPSVDEINDLLPPSIRVFKVITTTADFSARRKCDARTSEFLIPVRYVTTTQKICSTKRNWIRAWLQMEDMPLKQAEPTKFTKNHFADLNGS